MSEEQDRMSDAEEIAASWLGTMMYPESIPRLRDDIQAAIDRALAEAAERAKAFCKCYGFTFGAPAFVDGLEAAIQGKRAETPEDEMARRFRENIECTKNWEDHGTFSPRPEPRQTAGEVEALRDGLESLIAKLEVEDPMPDAPNYSIHGIARALRRMHVEKLRALLARKGE